MRSPEPTTIPIHVLLVEDNPDHAELVMRNFQSHTRARITHVSDGEAALNYLFRRGRFDDFEQWQLPHVVLLDLRLPKVDGLDVLQQIKSSGRFEGMPIVVLTTSQADSDVHTAYQRHVNSYLVKPLDFAQFAQLMTDIGSYWLDWNHYSWQPHALDRSAQPT